MSPVIAVFDIGKTNKKLLLFDEDYRIVYEKSQRLPEIQDEDGFPCEDVAALTRWVLSSLSHAFKIKDFEIKVVNFSAHGASFVNLDEYGKPVTPLYNYLKPFAEHLRAKFYETYGIESVPLSTASPILGNLNSAMQLYWLKHERPDAFRQIKYALHLPAYISHLITGKYYSDITSIGCHTQLWNFDKSEYHRWIHEEGILEKLAPILPSNHVLAANFEDHKIIAGIGLHDSSAALIPYLKCFTDPFVLISTGTWNISLNPFNENPLTAEELNNGCLCYLSHEGNPVKASRLFAGHEHDEEVKRMAAHFNKSLEFIKSISYDAKYVSKKQDENFAQIDFSKFSTIEEGYHGLMIAIVDRQIKSTELVIHNSAVKNIYVDGGFSSNPIFMNLLVHGFPKHKVYGATIPHASALGAGLAIHPHWNDKNVSTNLVQLRSC